MLLEKQEMNTEQLNLKNERIKYLKQIKITANKYLDENKSIKSESKGWKLNVVENNISQLKKIILDLNKSLHDNSLQNYVRQNLKLEKNEGNNIESKFNLSSLWREMHEGLMSFKLLRFSASYSIAHDLYWIEDGSLDDQIAISNGEKSPEILSQYLKDKVFFAEKVILPFLLKDEKYKSVHEVFKTSIFESNKKSYLTSNILLITAIESLVRLLAKFIYSNQNPSLSKKRIDKYIFKDFLSLEGLISKGEWKEDLSIELMDAIVMNEYIFDESLEKAEEKRKKHIKAQQKIEKMFSEVADFIKSELTEENKVKTIRKVKLKFDEIQDFAKDKLINENDKTRVSLKTNLQFLLRGYKEDRNQLIHGNFENFNKGWKNYIYFSALKKVYLLIQKYNEKYKTA